MDTSYPVSTFFLIVNACPIVLRSTCVLTSLRCNPCIWSSVQKVAELPGSKIAYTVKIELLFLPLICTDTIECTSSCSPAPMWTLFLHNYSLLFFGSFNCSWDMKNCWMLQAAFKAGRFLQFLLTWPCVRQPKQTLVCLRRSSFSWCVSSCWYNPVCSDHLYIWSRIRFQ